MNNTETLLKIKEKLENDKIQKARLEGNLENFLKGLKEEFGCENPEEAKLKLDVLEKEIQEDEHKLEQEISKLEEMLQ